MKELVYNNASGEYNKLLSDYEIQYRNFWGKKNKSLKRNFSEYKCKNI